MANVKEARYGQNLVVHRNNLETRTRTERGHPRGSYSYFGDIGKPPTFLIFNGEGCDETLQAGKDDELERSLAPFPARESSLLKQKKSKSS